MKPFDKIKYVGGPKDNRKVHYGYYIAGIPKELQKNCAKVIILDEDLNAKRVKSVEPMQDTQVLVGADPCGKEQINFATLPPLLKGYIGGGVQRQLQLAKEQCSRREGNELRNGDKVEVRELKCGNWEGDCTFIGMDGGAYVVSDKYNSYRLMTYCRKQTKQKVLPPMEHFNGATQYQVKETYGVWRKGDIVNYVGSDNDDPLKWTFERLYPLSVDGRKPKQTGKIHFNNLTPLITSART